MTTRTDHDADLHDELGRHLRRTLAAVAATIHEEPVSREEPTVVPTRPRRRRRLLLAAGAVAVAVPLAAAAVVGFGPEHVDQIPPPDPIISGSLDGERYWVVDGRDVPRCEGRLSGIELVAEQHNIVGREWNTVGAVFGEPVDGCGPVRVTDPPEDTYYSDGGLMVGDGMLWMGALHPDVDEVRADLGGEPFDVRTFDHEGAAYFVLEVPPGTETFTVDYVVDGRVLAPPGGESAEHVLPGG